MNSNSRAWVTYATSERQEEVYGLTQVFLISKESFTQHMTNAHRLAKILVVLIFGLLLLGGIVHNTGSSLACPDWPTCYGSLMPKMEGGVAIEHSHRLFAATVGLLTIVLAFLLYRQGGLLRRLGFL